MKIRREKIQKISKLSVFSFILFILLMIWLMISVRNVDSAAEKSRSDSVRRTVMNGVSLCYSIEGEYPADIEYLEDNYGVRIDHDRYIVHYDYFGANIRPSVTVTDKNAGKKVSADEQS